MKDHPLKRCSCMILCLLLGAVVIIFTSVIGPHLESQDDHLYYYCDIPYFVYNMSSQTSIYVFNNYFSNDTKSESNGDIEAFFETSIIDATPSGSDIVLTNHSVDFVLNTSYINNVSGWPGIYIDFRIYHESSRLKRRIFRNSRYTSFTSDVENKLNNYFGIKGVLVSLVVLDEYECGLTQNSMQIAVLAAQNSDAFVTIVYFYGYMLSILLYCFVVVIIRSSWLWYKVHLYDAKIAFERASYFLLSTLYSITQGAFLGIVYILSDNLLHPQHDTYGYENDSNTVKTYISLLQLLFTFTSFNYGIFYFHNITNGLSTLCVIRGHDCRPALSSLNAEAAHHFGSSFINGSFTIVMLLISGNPMASLYLVSSKLFELNIFDCGLTGQELYLINKKYYRMTENIHICVIFIFYVIFLILLYSLMQSEFKNVIILWLPAVFGIILCGMYGISLHGCGCYQQWYDNKNMIVYNVSMKFENKNDLTKFKEISKSRGKLLHAIKQYKKDDPPQIQIAKTRTVDDGEGAENIGEIHASCEEYEKWFDKSETLKDTISDYFKFSDDFSVDVSWISTVFGKQEKEREHGRRSEKKPLSPQKSGTKLNFKLTATD